MSPVFGILGITNDTLNLVVQLLLLFLIAVWAALVFWTFSDARRRIEDPMLIGWGAAAPGAERVRGRSLSVLPVRRHGRLHDRAAARVPRRRARARTRDRGR